MKSVLSRWSTASSSPRQDSRCRSSPTGTGLTHQCRTFSSNPGYGLVVPTNRLSLSVDTHVRTEANTFGSGSKRLPTPFLDLVVDGVPMRVRSRAAGYGDNFVTALSAAWLPPSVATGLSALRDGTPQGELADVLICSYCGDRDCGALLVEVRVLDDTVTWSNWTWTNWEDTEPASGLDNFEFSRADYDHVLDGAAALLAAQPYDEVRPQERVTRGFWRSLRTRG